MRDSMSIHDLSACIAESIAKKLASERESGRISEDCVSLDLAGLIGGEEGSRIDFGTFDISSLVHRQGIQQDDVALLPSRRPSEGGSPPDSEVRDATPRYTRHRDRRRQMYNNDSDSSESAKRRKLTGGLRLAPLMQQSLSQDSIEPEAASGRQLQTASRSLPQRKAIPRDEHAMRPSTLGKLIVGIWEQIFSSIGFDMSAVVDEWREAKADQGYVIEGGTTRGSPSLASEVTGPPNRAFSQMNIFCRKISQASRVSRALEVVVQARWIEHLDDRIRAILEERDGISQTKAKMAALAEACRDFGWTEKELRNKMAIWRGYKEIKDAGGWVCLVFAGMGIYRFCKYRVSFTQEAMQLLRRHRSRFEVAADTLHPHWREMLSVVDAASPPQYIGHPHDWVVSDYESPIPLSQSYLQWDPQFTFNHLDTSIIDVHAWGASDPRLVTPQSFQAAYVCGVCGETQSDDATENGCTCFPNLYGSSHIAPVAVQVFRTRNGKNNGLIACCPFDRGTAIGEFVGLVTKDQDGVDIMQAEADQCYQIWQGREGNHTRFVNHSCRPNSQFQRFHWMGVQRVVLVSRGIEGGQEITVDYSDSYWKNLNKVCLCNQSCCRFKDRARVTSG